MWVPTKYICTGMSKTYDTKRQKRVSVITVQQIGFSVEANLVSADPGYLVVFRPKGGAYRVVTAGRRVSDLSIGR